MAQPGSEREPFYVEHAKRLNERGEVKELLALIEHSPNAKQAAAAAEVLADSGDPRGVEALYRRLEAMGRGPFPEDLRPFPELDLGDWRTLASALASLEGPGSPWADELLALLKEEDTPVGWSAGELLANMGDRRAIEPMIESLAATDASDAESTKCERLASALGDLRAVEAVDVLSAALREAHWTIQEEIAYALTKIGDPRAVSALVAALEAQHGYYRDAENAIWLALDEFGTPEAKQATEAYRRSLPKPSADASGSD